MPTATVEYLNVYDTLEPDGTIIEAKTVDPDRWNCFLLEIKPPKGKSETWSLDRNWQVCKRAALAITLCLTATLAHAQTIGSHNWSQQQQQQYQLDQIQSQLDDIQARQSYEWARQIDRQNQLRQQRLFYGFPPPLLGDPD